MTLLICQDVACGINCTLCQDCSMFVTLLVLYAKIVFDIIGTLCPDCCITSTLCPDCLWHYWYFVPKLFVALLVLCYQIVALLILCTSLLVALLVLCAKIVALLVLCAKIEAISVLCPRLYMALLVLCAQIVAPLFPFLK